MRAKVVHFVQMFGSHKPRVRADGPWPQDSLIFTPKTRAFAQKNRGTKTRPPKWFLDRKLDDKLKKSAKSAPVTKKYPKHTNIR